jgi:uncharacterized protein (DUF1778 family)
MAGRPKKPDTEAMQAVLRIRMTAEDRALLDAAARLKSLETSSWVRSEMVALARRILAKQ